MKNNIFISLSLLVGLFFIAGCATGPMVEPTFAELNAVRAYKKTVAVINISEAGSEVQGISPLVTSKLESLLIGYCNVVERAQINQVIHQRTVNMTQNPGDMSKLGNLLGVDYIVFGNVTADISGPYTKHTESNHDGHFYGSIWEVMQSDAEISVKIVDVSNGTIVFSKSKKGSVDREVNRQSFSDQTDYYKTLNTKNLTSGIMNIAKLFTSMKNDYSQGVSDAINSSVYQFRPDFRKLFMHSGEILEIISENEVIVNLGSAYGINRGDKLIVWMGGEAIEDPKTGMKTFPKEKKITLTVTGVTSGLTSIAKGRKKDILLLSVGDKIYTN